MNHYIGQTKIAGGWVSFTVLANNIYEAQSFVTALPDVSGTCVSKALTPGELRDLRAHVANHPDQCQGRIEVRSLV